MTSIFRREPVLIILEGLAAVVSLGLIAANALDWTHLDGTETAAVVAFVAAVATLVAAAIRGVVWSPDSVDQVVGRVHVTHPPTVVVNGDLIDSEAEEPI